MIILTSDTKHHRYFINKLLQWPGISIEHIYFETNHKATEPFYDKEQDEFENNFFDEVPYELSVPITEIASVNDLQLEHTTLGIVFGTGRIKPHIIDKFDILLNVHRGISQDYRGLDSDLWAIHWGDFTRIGTTIHLVEPTLDTGAIVKQGTITIKPGMEIWQLRYYTTVLAADLTIKALLSPLDPKPQNKGRYFSAMPLGLKELVKDKFDRYVRHRCLI